MSVTCLICAHHFACGVMWCHLMMTGRHDNADEKVYFLCFKVFILLIKILMNHALFIMSSLAFSNLKFFNLLNQISKLLKN